MRVRQGVYPTDALVRGVGRIDYAIDALSARLRGRPTLREYLRNNFDIIVSGYPRSGNSFLAEALRILGGGRLRVGAREHSPLVSYAAGMCDVPVLIPIREPVGTIASWFLFRDEKLDPEKIRLHVDSYTKWFTFVDLHRSRKTSFVVPFEVFTVQPEVILMSNFVDEMIYSPAVPVQVDEVLEILQRKEADERGPAYVERASLPVELRFEQSERVRSLFEQPCVASALQKAHTAYLRLRDSEPTWSSAAS